MPINKDDLDKDAAIIRQKKQKQKTVNIKDWEAKNADKNRQAILVYVIQMSFVYLSSIIIYLPIFYLSDNFSELILGFTSKMNEAIEVRHGLNNCRILRLKSFEILALLFSCRYAIFLIQSTWWICGKYETKRLNWRNCISNGNISLSNINILFLNTTYI